MNLEQIRESLAGLLASDGARSDLLLRLAETAILIAVLVLLQQLIYRLINENVPEIDRRHRMRVWARTTTLFAVVLAVTLLWVPSGQTLLQILALLAAGLALTLARPILSFISWLVILVRAPFRIGDRVELGRVRGDVVDIGLLHIHLLEIGNWVDGDQSTGRLVHVPNSVIFDGPIYNYSEGFDLIWNELTVVITHQSDWDRARELLLEQAQPLYREIEPHAIEAADKMARRYAYVRGITTPMVYVELLRDGIQLSLRYLVEPRRRRGSAHDITLAFLNAIAADPTIELAAPGTRVRLVDGRDGRPTTESQSEARG